MVVRESWASRQPVTYVAFRIRGLWMLTGRTEGFSSDELAAWLADSKRELAHIELAGRVELATVQVIELDAELLGALVDTKAAPSYWDNYKDSVDGYTGRPV
jgi:hypothetical protein